MNEITVKYSLEDEDFERLKKITEGYTEQGLKGFTPEKMFENIMCTGSKYNVDEKFKFHEWKLGLRVDFK